LGKEDTEAWNILFNQNIKKYSKYLVGVCPKDGKVSNRRLTVAKLGQFQL
jgi:hypothetical protein